MAEKFYYDNLAVDTGKTNFYYDFIGATVEEKDINNDFRSRDYWTLEDINNDFRMISTLVRADINNDFRLFDYANIDIVNDFRMVGLTVRDNINNDFRDRKEETDDIDNKFNMVTLEIEDINNKFNSVVEEINDLNNIISIVKEVTEDVSNDFRSQKETNYNISNDFRMLIAWQEPISSDIGFQSSGKSELKVYINSVEQTDVDVDSITITQSLNVSANCSFVLGRAYDSTKPETDSEIEVKYQDITLYSGYITEIIPGDDPESMTINCQDEYWKLNKTKKYFFVGRKPAETNEYYFENIQDALENLEFNYDIGNFIPQTMDLYGKGKADCISELVQNCGNFGWYIDANKNYKIWKGGKGNIISLERQSLNTNLGLYQVIRHSITESVLNIVNKLRVLMGNWTIKENSTNPANGSGSKTYEYTWHEFIETYAIPAWDNDKEIVAKDSSTGYGYDHQDPDVDYSDVFTKFYLPDLDPETESWSDLYPPLVRLIYGNYPGFTNISEYIIDGFTLDYGFKTPFGYPLGASDLAKPNISFSEPAAVYDENSQKNITNIRPKIVKLYLWKEKKTSYIVSDQNNPDDEPSESEDNPLMFYTEKVGDYSDTILETLQLGNLSKQDGFILKDDDGNIIENIPTWDDTIFAEDMANWQLSKTAYKKYTGTIDVTIDTMIYYNIELGKRIKILDVLDPINITSISYNFNSWIATLTVESYHEYERTVSIPYRGE